MFVYKLFLSVVLTSLLSMAAFAQSTGVITGVITDDAGNNPLQGASVSVEGTPLTTQTDRTGRFKLVGVPTGEQTLMISYLGFKDKTVKVTVTSDSNATVTTQLETSVSEVVIVNSPFLEGQAKALNKQKEAANITNIVSANQIGRFPDPNSAEAAQRIPGITIERDQGEGRFVQVRGTEARLNAMQIDGERIPSPEGDARAVALDVIPADLLEAIEVSKALTADQDADSIGGSVNLITKAAPSKTRVSFTTGFGYNAISSDYLQNFNGTIGSRFMQDRLGLLFSASYLNTDRGSDNFEVEYDDGNLEDLQLRDYTINRKRWGFNPFIDYRSSETTRFFFKGIFNQFDDQEFRRRTRYRISDERIERELKDRFESQNIWQGTFGGESLISNRISMDFSLSYAFADEVEPERLDTTYRQNDVIFNPNVSPTSIDPDNIQANPQNEDFGLYEFDEASFENNVTTERAFRASANFSAPLPVSTNFAGNIKFGFKNRFNRKFRNNDVTVFEFFQNEPAFTSVLDNEFQLGTFLDGRYNQGSQIVDPTIARQIITSADAESEFDFEEETADYRASENIFAAYAMTQLNFGEKFQLLPGFRYERTDVDYTGTEILFDTNGDFLSRNDIPGENTFNNYFASIHAKYQITDKTNFRASFSQSMARPNYVDLAPFQLILEEDLEIVRGNSNLLPTTANNIDVLVEHYFDNVGVISGGFFYKRLKNYIFPFTFEEERAVGGGILTFGTGTGTETFDVTEPRNGDSADLYGFEIAFQKRFSFLPGPFDGLGVYTNYTFVDSEARLPGEDLNTFRDSVLPGQAQNVANFAVSYEKYGFSGRASLHFRDEYLSEVTSSTLTDIFVDDHLQLDVNFSQRITKNIRVFAEFLNLTNEPFRVYEGLRTRPIQEEYYRWWSTFGLKFDW